MVVIYENNNFFLNLGPPFLAVQPIFMQVAENNREQFLCIFIARQHTAAVLPTRDIDIVILSVCPSDVCP